LIYTVVNKAFERFGSWAARNSGCCAAGLIAFAFFLRFYYCRACYLNPDEAAHYVAARQTSWPGTLESAFELAHPPLFILVLHGVLFIGRGELALRSISLLAGTAALWFTFVWLRRSLGIASAIVGVTLLALSPAAVSAATEIRQYGLFFFFLSAALYATERTLSGQLLKYTNVL
jgi:Dolichyl-phosphate-mannose-protein mannosyltransferase